MDGWVASTLANVFFIIGFFLFTKLLSASLLRLLTESYSCVLQSVECPLWCNEGDKYAMKTRLSYSLIHL